MSIRSEAGSKEGMVVGSQDILGWSRGCSKGRSTELCLKVIDHPQEVKVFSPTGVQHSYDAQRLRGGLL